MANEIPSEQNHATEHGDHQSPIDIDFKCINFDPTLKPLQFTNDPADCVDIMNIGTTWSIGVRNNPNTKLQGTHLPGIYRLAEVHAHWGTQANDGTEHMVNKNRYAAEIHLVHYNEAHSVVDAAKRHGDGLAVLGILLQESSDDNPALAPLIEALKKIPYKGQSTKFPQGLNFQALLPSNKDFCTYCGSLTTPPYTECVVWTVLTNPIPISKKQLQVFRSLNANEQKDNGGKNIVNNVRPCQPIGKRIIKISFKP